MNANELRIGNWVKDYNGRELQLTGIAHDLDGFEGYFLQFGKGNITLLKDDELAYIEPIPITPEWLERFGFEVKPNDFYVNDYQYLKYIDDDESTYFDGIGTYGWHSGDKSLVVNTLCRGNYVCGAVQYIHQLQNLYFALTGHELEIK